MLKAKMEWKGNYKFEGLSTFGHKIITDAGKAAGGEEAGYKPPELILYGIAGCTGIDIVRLMKKQRQEMTSLEIEVTAYNQEECPKPFHTFEIKY